MKLTEHFTLEDLTDSDMALRLGIDNTPPANVIANLRDLAIGLESMRLMLGRPMRIHSGYRCEALERVLCAKDFAAWCARHRKDPATAWPEYFERKGHPKGYCADWTCPDYGPPIVIVRYLNSTGIRFDQLIQEGTWVHASFDPRMRRQILTASFDANGTPSYAQGVG